MMRKRTMNNLGGLILLLMLASIFTPVVKPAAAAASPSTGLPGSAEFAYGARLDIQGQHIQTAIHIAAGLGLDWLAMDLDWGMAWPAVDSQAGLEPLIQAMDQARNENLKVVLAITHAPQWAMTATGPDPVLTAALVSGLAQQYPDTLLAIELFPEANTIRGWGAAPDARAYIELVKAAQASLKNAGISITIIAGGLVPLPAGSVDGIDDLAFLDQLYQAGAAEWFPVVSIRLNEITGDPMAFPTGGENRVLRHFEEVRRLMLQNDHEAGLLWISSFFWPTGALQASDQVYADEEAQSRWLSQAYKLLRAQLYIGAAFYGRLNPPNPEVAAAQPVTSLVLDETTLHPACNRIGQLISLEGSIQSVVFQSSISKKTPLKLNLKP